MMQRDETSLIPYASRTGTRRNLAALRAAGWRLLVTPEANRTEGFQYALDNGAWTAHAKGRPWIAAPFEALVARLGAEADFIVLPDIVAGGLVSLALSLEWRRRLDGAAPMLLLPVQDGMTVADVAPHLSVSIGIFVGGTTQWKLDTMRQWAMLAKASGCYLHIGRVNSRRRIRLCHLVGAHSFDGSGPARFAKHLAQIDPEVHQPSLFGRRVCVGP